MPAESLTSANFKFLVVHDRLLDHLGALAERYFANDPSTCLLKLRQFGEVLAQRLGLRDDGHIVEGLRPAPQQRHPP